MENEDPLVRGAGTVSLLLPCSIGTLLLGFHVEFLQFVVPSRLGMVITIM